MNDKHRGVILGASPRRKHSCTVSIPYLKQLIRRWIDAEIICATASRTDPNYIAFIVRVKVNMRRKLNKYLRDNSN